MSAITKRPARSHRRVGLGSAFVGLVGELFITVDLPDDASGGN